MLSSTSSSNDRLPRGNWAQTWIVAVTMVVVLAGGWETVLRVRGLGVAAVDDSAELWARERERAAELGKDAVILVGASRMQMGIDLEVMRRYTTRTPVQLAISASPFMPVLEDLANDDRVTGTVVVSFTMQDFLSVTVDSVAARWVKVYESMRSSRTRLFSERLEDSLRTDAAALLVSVGSGARPQQLFSGSGANYVRTLPDRSQRADYETVDREAAYRRRVAIYLSGEEPVFQSVPDLEARLAALESLIRKLEDRGAAVILVRFPTTRRIWEMDQIRYPKDVYWDEVVKRTSARTIHFTEFPSLSGFDLPDGVHLDYRDVPRFTAALSALLF
jgi:hypothetical protein